MFFLGKFSKKLTFQKFFLCNILLKSFFFKKLFKTICFINRKTKFLNGAIRIAYNKVVGGGLCPFFAFFCIFCYCGAVRFAFFALQKMSKKWAKKCKKAVKKKCILQRWLHFFFAKKNADVKSKKKKQIYYLIFQCKTLQTSFIWNF